MRTSTIRRLNNSNHFFLVVFLQFRLLLWLCFLGAHLVGGSSFAALTRTSAASTSTTTTCCRPWRPFSSSLTNVMNPFKPSSAAILSTSKTFYRQSPRISSLFAQSSSRRISTHAWAIQTRSSNSLSPVTAAHPLPKYRRHHYQQNTRCYSHSAPLTMMATGEEMMIAMSDGNRKTLIGNDIPLAMESFLKADCVCFDVDSTVIQEEGIDVLADYLGKGQEVADLTKRAMEGGMKFQDALEARLDLLEPSKADIEACLRKRPFKFTPGIQELVERLHDANKHVFLVSGGFRIMIEPIAERLQIPIFNIFANTIYFENDEDENKNSSGFIFDDADDDDNEGKLYDGFDDTEPTSQDMGKAKALEMIKSRSKDGSEDDDAGYQCMVMIGDGFTDSQAKPPAAAFIGFGGVVIRKNVQAVSDWYITDFKDLIRLMDEFPNRKLTPFFPK